MQKIIKLNPIFNKFKNTQILDDETIKLIIKPILQKSNHSEKIKQSQNLFNLYNKKIISYTTLLYFILKKNHKNNYTKSNNFLFNELNELKWESGFFLTKKSINQCTLHLKSNSN
jgi:hypothetical protein